MIKKNKFKIKTKKDLYEKIIGIHSIESIMSEDPRRAIKLMILDLESKRLKNLKKIADYNNIPVKIIKNSCSNKETTLICKPFQYANLIEQLKLNLNLILMFDCLQDSGNLGRASRSALCFDVDLIIIMKNRSAKINITTEKIAVGALSKIPVAKVTNLAKTIEVLKKNKFSIIGTDSNANVNSYNYEFNKKTALIIGGEESGVRELIKKKCDQIIKIPMRNKNINLNAADASAILLYEISRQIN